MRYDKRCELIYYKKSDGLLGDGSVYDRKKLVPCSKKIASYKEQINILGKYNPSAVKIHIQGEYSDFRYIKIDGIEYTPNSIRPHKNSTVVIVS